MCNYRLLRNIAIPVAAALLPLLPLQVLHAVINTIWGDVAVVIVGNPGMKLLVKSTEDTFGIEIEDVDPGTIETKNRFVYLLY